jgi:hypothetical protein
MWKLTDAYPGSALHLGVYSDHSRPQWYITPIVQLQVRVNDEYHFLSYLSYPVIFHRMHAQSNRLNFVQTVLMSITLGLIASTDLTSMSYESQVVTYSTALLIKLLRAMSGMLPLSVMMFKQDVSRGPGDRLPHWADKVTVSSS